MPATISARSMRISPEVNLPAIFFATFSRSQEAMSEEFRTTANMTKTTTITISQVFSIKMEPIVLS